MFSKLVKIRAIDIVLTKFGPTQVWHVCKNSVNSSYAYKTNNLKHKTCINQWIFIYFEDIKNTQF